LFCHIYAALSSSYLCWLNLNFGLPKT
jgi:hypothetical protein